MSVAGTVSGSALSYLALSASMVAVTFQVSCIKTYVVKTNPGFDRCFEKRGYH